MNVGQEDRPKRKFSKHCRRAWAMQNGRQPGMRANCLRQDLPRFFRFNTADFLKLRFHGQIFKTPGQMTVLNEFLAPQLPVVLMWMEVKRYLMSCQGCV